jgi:hypothetical protein
MVIRALHSFEAILGCHVTFEAVAAASHIGARLRRGSNLEW